MKRLYSAVVFLIMLVACNAKAPNPENQPKQTTTSVPQKTKKLQPKSVKSNALNAQVERLLAEFLPLKDKLTNEELILKVARHFIGIPYVAHTLDRNPNEQLVVNLKEMDCTTYLENVIAIVFCVKNSQSTYQDFTNMLQKIRYQGGILAYENRLHYYQWWVTDNEKMGFLTEISAPNPPFTATQRLKINYMSENFMAYDMLKNNPERIAKVKKKEDATNGKIVNYIPKSEIKNTQLLRQIIHDGDIIALVTNKRNLDTTHLGIAVWHKDGLHLLNASSLQKNKGAVVEPTETLYDYLKTRPYNIGIRVARLKL